MAKSAEELFGYFTIREFSYTLSAADTQLVAQQNPQRVAIIFSASANPTGYRISPKSDATKDDGLWIPDGVAPVQFSHPTHGALVGQAWHGHVPAGVCVLTVVEVLMPKVPCGDEA